MPVTTFPITNVDTGTETFTTTPAHNQPNGTPAFISATVLPTGLTQDGGGGVHSVLYYLDSVTADTFKLVDRAGTLIAVSTGGTAPVLQLAEGSAHAAPANVFASGECEVSNVPLAYTLTVAALATGSAVRITQNDTGALLFQGNESGGLVQFNTQYKGLMDIEARKADSTPIYRPWFGSATLSDAHVTVNAVQARED